ncbi:MULTISPECIES: NUDIX hydrolase [unclassified Acidovorax]|uniref:NUDIX hydrolase n=1 Tax=unclassified Acidovorax TaxID=2684926 RepID=UPI000BC6FD0B|nr:MULTISPECIES: NUDIX hydrolase [unclassified Acidovorax]HQS21297.1 NUDIX hydrolase [Acidovorax defluvii]OYY27944.1 MAG: NUDIX hydrolase [Acidovorax sp. 35-64-16]OYZ46044.1 MAG: NUDIX hydrolase [Acidovorax sp. 16-64-162]OYZ71421.1 MAG: NUDIX hydrolase [Acidovorax sp. 24-64-9]OZA69950.1 MAG: NUDIX hydrolase [Acidovorax sp. 39-64-12]
MQPAAPGLPETPRAAATVVLLRDSTAGPEVLLLRRNAQASNMAGVYVFPGGKLDADDATLDADTHLDQPHATLHANLNEPDTHSATAAGLYVAALREALEECGLLLAEPLGGTSAVNATRARAMLREGQPFAQVLGALQLRLQTRQLAPWSRWVTPLAPTMGTRRFDTRFFVAQAPADQTALHDNEETTDSVWLAPRAALEQYRDGRIDLAPPQIMSLAHLARHASVASVLDAARRQPPPLILPEPFDHNGVRVLCYPGDAMHPVRERALPGPTRLHYHARRFTPEDGFEALFR